MLLSLHGQLDISSTKESVLSTYIAVRLLPRPRLVRRRFPTTGWSCSKGSEVREKTLSLFSSLVCALISVFLFLYLVFVSSLSLPLSCLCL